MRFVFNPQEETQQPYILDKCFFGSFSIKLAICRLASSFELHARRLDHALNSFLWALPFLCARDRRVEKEKAFGRVFFERFSHLSSIATPGRVREKKGLE